jgi:hypothetical protein
MSRLGNRFMLTEYREHGTREVILDLFLQRLTVGMHPVGSAIADLFVPNEEVRNSGPYENRARPESEPL